MTQDTEDVVILSSRCGYHFEEDCHSCQSAKDSNDYRLQSLSDRIDVLEGALREIGHEGPPFCNAEWMRGVARAALHQEATAKPLTNET